MNRLLLGWAWNSIATATIVTLLVGMFALALPRVHRATATVEGSPDAILEIRSAAFLSGVVENTSLKFDELGTFRDVAFGRNSADDRLTRLVKSMNVSPGEKGNWIDISVDAPDAELAAAVANEVARHYLRGSLQNQAPEMEAAILERLETAEAALRAYRNEVPEARNLSVRIAETINSIEQRELRRAELESEIERLKKHREQITEGDYESLLPEQSVRLALNQRDQILLKREQLAARYGPHHQKMIAVNAELAGAEQRVDEELKRGGERTTQNIDLVSSQYGKVRGEIAEQKAALERLFEVESRVHSLEADRDAAERRYQSMVNKTIDQNFAAAVVPEDLIASRLLEILSIVFIASVLIIGAALMLRYRMQSVP